jgi:hypothetical protein
LTLEKVKGKGFVLKPLPLTFYDKNIDTFIVKIGTILFTYFLKVRGKG